MILRLALAQIGRSRKRASLTVLAVALAVFAVLMFHGFATFSYWALAESFTRSGGGHVQIGTAAWFAGDEGPGAAREAMVGAREALAHGPGAVLVEATSLVKRFRGTVRGPAGTAVFTLGTGVEPAPYLRMMAFAPVSRGEWLRDDDPFTVVLGRALADAVGARVGDLVTVQAATLDGRPNALDVKVVGFVETRSADHDRAFLVLPLATTAELLASDVVDALVVGARATSDTDALLRAATRAAKGMRVEPWHAVADYYVAVKSIYDRLFGAVLAMMLALTAAVVVNAVWMSMAERRGEIGMLRAVGAGIADVRRIFVVEAFVVAALGASLGGGAALLTSFVIALLGGIPMAPPPGMTEGYALTFMIDGTWALVLAALIVTLAVVVALVQADRGSRMNIARAVAGFEG